MYSAMYSRPLGETGMIPCTIESDVGFLPNGEAYAFSYGDCLGPKGEEVAQSEQVFWQGVQSHILNKALVQVKMLR